jgi:ABC-2 type transport system ATP-binding protein
MLEPVLSVESMTHLYGEKVALMDVNFSVQSGEIFGLLGPNGAGKTTAISIISGLLQPVAGNVRVFGYDLRKQSMDARRRMGVVPQEIALYPELSALENLIFWGRLSGMRGALSRDRARELLSEMGLEKREKDRVDTLSGGMKRRINIACALMHDPELLLLDEPTVGVDPQAREKMMEWMRKWVGEKRAILYTTHYLEEAERLCNRVAILDNGKILASNSIENLIHQIDGDQLITLYGDYHKLDIAHENFLTTHFKIIGRGHGELVLSPIRPGVSVDAIRDILTRGFPVDRITWGRPGLHEVFLNLTGKDLRE